MSQHTKLLIGWNVQQTNYITMNNLAVSHLVLWVHAGIQTQISHQEQNLHIGPVEHSILLHTL